MSENMNRSVSYIIQGINEGCPSAKKRCVTSSVSKPSNDSFCLQDFVSDKSHDEDVVKSHAVREHKDTGCHDLEFNTGPTDCSKLLSTENKQSSFVQVSSATTTANESSISNYSNSRNVTINLNLNFSQYISCVPIGT
jgi:hypothetical protein